MLRLHIIGLLLIASAGCQTASLVTKVDVRRKNIEIQSQADIGSAVLALQKDGALESLEKDLLALIEKNPKDVDSLLNLSQIRLAQGKFDDADRFCKQALKYDLNNSDAKLILAQTYYRRGYIDMADILLNSLGKASNKDAIALNLKGLIELSRDRPSYAMHLFKESLKYNPGDVATRMNLGVLYVHYRQIGRAAVEFERVLKVMPNHIDAKMHLGVIKASQGQYQQSEQLYKEVMDADPKNALALYNLAVLEEKRKNYDDSLDYLKAYLESNYAKEQRNKEVFAMIERIKTKKEMQGDKVSDSEIKELAEQIRTNSEELSNRPQPTPQRQAQAVEEKKVVKRSTSSRNAKKTETKPKYRPEDNSIEALEKVLEE